MSKAAVHICVSGAALIFMIMLTTSTCTRADAVPDAGRGTASASGATAASRTQQTVRGSETRRQAQTQPTPCFPACTNGGKCTAAGKRCKCPRGFKGKYCQTILRVEDQNCTGRTVQRGFNLIQKKCCVLPNGRKLDCSSGSPVLCTNVCAATFLPIWDNCAAAMPEFALKFGAFQKMCAVTAADAGNIGGVGAGSSLLDPTNSACKVNQDAPFAWVEISDSFMARKGGPDRPRTRRNNATFGTRIAPTQWKSIATPDEPHQRDDGWFDLNLAAYPAWQYGFVFYGVAEKVITIGTNGLLTFGTNQFPYGDTEPIPCAGHSKCADGSNYGHDVDGMIAVDWADLNTDGLPSNRGVYYLVTDTQIVIEWAGIKSYTWSGDPNEVSRPDSTWHLKDPGQTFQVILFPDGSFKMQYLKMYCKTCTTSSSPESIGFEDQTGLKGEQILYGQVPTQRSAYFIPGSCTTTATGGAPSQN